MQELPHTYSCFVCGEANPHGLRLRFVTDGRKVQTDFVPRSEHSGFRHTIHGGLIAALLDETMVWACAVQTKRFGFCAELNVRFVQPLRPNQAAVARAEMVADRRGRLFEASAELRDKTGGPLASATGKYIPLKDLVAADLARDFVGDAAWLLGPGKGPVTSPRG